MSEKPDHLSGIQVTVLTGLHDISAQEWNSLIKNDPVFLKHEFLYALEQHQCVGPHFGWLPCHLILRSPSGELWGACPLYFKDNSYGEFVFDWDWADAYARLGKRYYPKLVCAIPYTPATGPRFLVADTAPYSQVSQLLATHAINLAQQEHCSSLHWLFTDGRDTSAFRDQGLLIRTGCQYHWQNNNYRDFQDFLEQFTAEKRKKIKRERRYVCDNAIEIDIKNGTQLSEEEWQALDYFYASTFLRKGGIATFNLNFFRQIGAVMGEQLLFAMARKQGKLIAGAICYRDNTTLYGRHWGCSEEYHSLHFELCYYQGIDYCIAQQLKTFEPGAQGEHKISRGFLPTPTYSAHWIADKQFRTLLTRHLEHETALMTSHMEELTCRSPYKQQA